MRIVYMGTGDIGIPALSALFESPEHEVIAVVTQPDRPAGRNLNIRPALVKKIALEKGVPVLQPEKIRKDLEPILTLRPDLIVVMAYGQILTKPILELPKVACLNLHASLLPRHRGASPIHTALLEGDAETGITVMYMEEGLDSGDILLKEPVSISPRETGGQLYARLAQIAPQALIKSLGLLAQGEAPRTPQDPMLVTYARKLTKEDARLNWNSPFQALDRKIRAMDPWPGAFCLWKRASTALRLRILESIPCQTDQFGTPGEILAVSPEGIEVAASQGSLLLRRIQLEGRKSMSAAEFARGHSVSVGMLFE